ncbi:hypothetical protein [Afipia felis]|uniref:Uncharacterized protein n=2 Tax=Afipia felis TaxID=1035 RepID=A0A380W5P1_AFIFE|nr:hypothetical protein [Afipia felis]EKS26513.1 hypothetical protein HMPREF9697_04029 [Afipia felis ATCC 53690]SUU76165.1 Uncharacterised protein [Afipia felis]SUU84232.1 Uncharacterised protein [Afipia felis]
MAEKTDISKIITTENIDLKASVAGLADLDFAKLASLLDVPLLPDATRDELNTAVVGAIVDHREQIAKDLAAQQAKREADDKLAAFLKTPEGKAHRKAVDDRARNVAVRTVHADFAGALPTEARQTGTFAVPDDHANSAQSAVPNGSYRVLGTDWLHRFKGGRWIGADRVAAHAKPDWTEVPDSAAGDPEVPAAVNG